MGLRGSRGGRIAALVAWSAVVFGAGFVVGLGISPAQTFWDILYSPLVPALIATAVPTAIWFVDRAGKKR